MTIARQAFSWMLLCLCVQLSAAAEPHEFTIADGAFQLAAPETWKVTRPRSRIIEHEFAIPAAKGDELGGRLTVMAAGGSVDANLQRWFDQFKQPDGGSTKEKAKVKQVKIADQNVTLVDISGTYTDRPAPMAPGVERPDYRMLGAIIETKNAGNYFFKFYGPDKTMGENAEGFQTMIEGLKAK